MMERNHGYLMDIFYELCESQFCKRMVQSFQGNERTGRKEIYMMLVEV